MRKFIDFLQQSAVIFIAGFVLYAVVAQTIFGFRHPWATSTEKIIYLPEALFFEKVSYNEMRPREN